jgi:hypothetical protein
LDLCSRDVTAVKIIYKSGGRQKKLIVPSVYLPHDLDKPPPIKRMRDATNNYYWSSTRKQLIIGCDANVHFIM